MKLTIFGATGGIGSQLVAQALAAGHSVTAVVRDPSRVIPGARAVQADLMHADDSEALRDAVAGADVVISTLGPRSVADIGIASAGTRAIVSAEKSTGVCRLLVISAAPIGTLPAPDRPVPPRHDPGDGFFMRHLLAPLT
ncbi:MAG: NAD(P)H-binding protein, partial [Candidatus Dormibacteraeota bacterium]|nr:NAD(P)H-binding protein [Candidatus Dormibacteraeota bacterium]